MNQKSDVVSKNVTISQATNVTTTTSYYCNGSYQSSSTCSSSYSATSSTSYSCSTGTSGGDGYCYTYSSGGGYSSYSECSTSCSGYCVSSSSYYKCYRKVKSGTATKTTSYSCPSGGTLSGTTCYNSYTGTLKYRCLNTYYDDNASATAACVNYCASGTYYNGKCYKLS